MKRAALLIALALSACSTTPGDVALERQANLEALEMWSGAASGYAVVQRGTVSVAENLPTALDVAGLAEDAAHRFVFEVGTPRETDHVLAFLPATGVVAGSGLADALGLQMRRRPSGEVVLARGMLLAPSPAEGEVEIVLTSLDDAVSRTVRAVANPDYRGHLLVSSALADEFGLARFEVPGEARVQIALGRPFAGRRALLGVGIPSLEADAVVEVVFDPTQPVTD